MTDKKFYKTIFQVTVLSEEPIGDMSIESVVSEMDTGDLVGSSSFVSSEELDAKNTADALYELGSEPSFFQLDDDGNDADDEENEVKASYDDGECPDCGETIPDDVTVGDECVNCGHVFCLPSPTNDASSEVS